MDIHIHQTLTEVNNNDMGGRGVNEEERLVIDKVLRAWKNKVNK